MQRCLEKDRSKRIADISTARFIIDEQANLANPANLASRRVEPAGGRRVLPSAVASVLLIGLGLLSFVHFRETLPLAAPEMRLEIVTPATTDPVSFALYPDGRQLVFVASGDGSLRLWLRPLASTTSQPLAGTDGRRVVVYRAVQSNTDIWLLDGSRASRFTFGMRARILNS